MCRICDDGSNYDIKGRARPLTNAILFELIEYEMNFWIGFKKKYQFDGNIPLK